MQKKTWQTDKKRGFGSDPPLVWEKFPHNPINFSEGVTYDDDDDGDDDDIGDLDYNIW